MKRSFEGEYPKMIPRRTDSINYILFGVVLGHSILHGGPGFYGFQEWVYEAISGNNSSEALTPYLSKDLIPLHAGSAKLLKFIEELDASSAEKDVDDTVGRYLDIINCSCWDPTKPITISNRAILQTELIYEELVRKRISQIQSIREGFRLIGFLPYIEKNKGLCKDLFIYNHVLNSTIFIYNLENNDHNRDDYEKKQAFNFFESIVNESSSCDLKKILRFTTGFDTIPPWGLRKPMSVKYLEDDEKKIYPEAMSCFNIIYLPTVYSNYECFKSNFLKALEIEGTGFSASF